MQPDASLLIGAVLWVTLASVGVAAYAKGARRMFVRTATLCGGLLIVGIFYYLSGRGTALPESIIGAPMFFLTATFSLLYGIGLNISGM